MTKKFRICLIVVALLVSLLAVGTGVASADTPTQRRYLDTLLVFDTPPVAGAVPSLSVTLWSSIDKGSWEEMSYTEAGFALRYLDAAGQPVSAPGQFVAGVYTAELYLADSAFDSAYYITSRTYYHVGDVLDSIAFTIAPTPTTVLFYPAEDISIHATHDGVALYEDIVSRTQVYLGDQLLTSGYTITVTNAGAPVTDIAQPGEYCITVTVGAETHRAVFRVNRPISELLSLSSRQIFAGMYTHADSALSSQYASITGVSVADIQALRSTYYTPTLAGDLATHLTANAVSYGVQYLQQVAHTPSPVSTWAQASDAYRILPTAPTAEGDYICRVTFHDAIPTYDIAAGSYVDLPYTVLPCPYSLTWSTSASTSTSAYGSYAILTPMGVGVSVPVVSSRYSDIPPQLTFQSGTTFYQFDYATRTYHQVPGSYLTQVGHYIAVLAIDLTGAPDGVITGSQYFGAQSAAYAIDKHNQFVEYEFDVISPYRIIFPADNVYTVGSAVLPRPTVKSSEGATLTTGLTTRFYLDGVAVNQGNEQADIAYVLSHPGTYTADAHISTFSVNGNIVASDEYFRYTIRVVPPARAEHVFVYDEESTPLTTMPVSGEGSILSALGFTLVEQEGYSVHFSQLYDGLYSTRLQSETMQSVGNYYATITFANGIYAGYVYNVLGIRASVIDVSSVTYAIPRMDNQGNIPYDGTPVVVPTNSIQWGATVSTPYALMYERQEGESWVVCGYPVLPGTYRFSIRFDENCTAFTGAYYGATLTRQFTILPLALTVRFGADVDLVYRNAPIALTPHFFIAGKPYTNSLLTSHYELWVNRLGIDTGYAPALPQNAGRYRTLAVFTRLATEPATLLAPFGIQMDAPLPVGAPEDTQQSFLVSRSILSAEELVIQPAPLYIEVSLPVGDKALYQETTPLYPTLSFYYAVSGAKGNAITWLDNNTVGSIFTQSFDTISYYAELTSLTGRLMTPAETPITPGKYQYNYTLTANATENMRIQVVRSIYDGGAADDFTYTQSTADELQVFYRVLPLHVEVAIPSFEGNQVYYGATYAPQASDLVFYTRNRLGIKDTPFSDLLRSNVSVTYYRATTDHTGVMGVPLAISPTTYLDAGSYLLRIEVEQDDERFVNLSFEDGTTISRGSQTDFYIDVLSAVPLSVVFERDFASFAADGNAKEFDVRFVANNTDVTHLFTNEQVRIDYIDTVGHTISAPATKGNYTIQVTFLQPIYRYQIQQLEGIYDNEGEEQYIGSGHTVRLPYAITEPKVLRWSWQKEGAAFASTSSEIAPVSYPFTSSAIDYTLYFYVQTGDALNAVSMTQSLDYFIRYYRVNNISGATSYEMLDSQPSEIGSYVAELLFLHDLPDYRAHDMHESVILGFQKADNTAGAYGKSLEKSGVITLSERRHVRFTITKGSIVVDQLSATTKAFDNTPSTQAAPMAHYTVTHGAAPADYVGGLNALLSLSPVGLFESVVCQTAGYVNYALPVGTSFLIMPHSHLIAEGQGVAYLLGQIEALRTQEGVDLALLSQIEDYILDIDSHYILSFANVTADIIPAPLTVAPQTDFSLYYNPFEEKDNEHITYTVQELSFLRTLVGMPDVDATHFFHGSLSMSNGAARIGTYPLIPATDFALISRAVTLSSGETVDIRTLFDVITLPATYQILPIRITVGTEESVLSRAYHEADLAVQVSVLAGELLFGDELSYVGGGMGKEGVSVGDYQITLNPADIRVVSGESDVSANYTIEVAPFTYRILPTTLTLLPRDDGQRHYPGDNYTPAISVHRDGLPYDISALGITISGEFGMIEMENTDEAVYRKYQLTLGNIALNKEGEDIRRNFAIGEINATYSVYKYDIKLQIDKSAVADRMYGMPEVKVGLLDANNVLGKYGLTLKEGSTVSREPGQDVGTYRYLATNEGTITILKGKEDVTDQCAIAVYKKAGGTRLDGDISMQITPLEVTVTVKHEIVYKSNRAYTPTLLYLGKDGNTLSPAVVALSRVTWGIPAQDLIEGNNLFMPRITSSVTEDANFQFTTRMGEVEVIFPENNLIVTPLDKNDIRARQNAYSFVNAQLFKTIKVYQIETANGQNPTKKLSLELPASQELMGEQVYVIAARKDGSFAMLSATSSEFGVVIEDTEFHYLLLAQREVWPYFALGGVALLAILCVVGILLRRKQREKVRGKKVDRIKEARKELRKVNRETKKAEAEQKAQQERLRKAAEETKRREEEARMAFVPKAPVERDIAEATELSVEDSAPVMDTPEENAVPTENAAQETKKEPKKGKKGKDAPTAFTPHSFAPSAGAASPRSSFESVPTFDGVPSLDDEIVLGNTLPTSSTDDDDDVISFGAHRLDDND